MQTEEGTSLASLEVVQIPVSEITEYPGNPRINDDAVQGVVESIRQFGFQQPLVLDSANIIIVGHTRFKAAKKLNLQTVPCVVAKNLSEEKVKAYRLLDNKLNEKAQWDLEKLDLELNDLEGFDFDPFEVSFEVEEEKKKSSGALADVEEDEAPLLEEVAVTELGDVWELGGHRLICADSTVQTSYEKLFASGNKKKSQLCLTDPPYNVDYTGKTEDALKIQNDKFDTPEDFRSFLFNAFSNMRAWLQQGCSFYVWHADSEGYAFRWALQQAGLTTRQCLIWNKDSMVLGRQDYHWKHEPCLYGWLEGKRHRWFADRTQTTILNFDRPKRSEDHPTSKPVRLFAYLIVNSSKEGDVVLDPFLGSGTTLMSCEQLGRRCYALELDPHYVDVCVRRWQQLTKQEAVLHGTTKTFDQIEKKRSKKA